MPRNESREMTEFIVQALSQGRDRADVAHEVAQRYEMNLRQAEGLVMRVETTFDRDITARRSPSYLAFSALAFLGGGAMLLIPVINILRPLITALASGATWQQASTGSSAILFNDMPWLLLGLGLVVAGIRGLRNSLWILRKK